MAYFINISILLTVWILWYEVPLQVFNKICFKFSSFHQNFLKISIVLSFKLVIIWNDIRELILEKSKLLIFLSFHIEYRINIFQLKILYNSCYHSIGLTIVNIVTNASLRMVTWTSINECTWVKTLTNVKKLDVKNLLDWEKI